MHPQRTAVETLVMHGLGGESMRVGRGERRWGIKRARAHPAHRKPRAATGRERTARAPDPNSVTKQRVRLRNADSIRPQGSVHPLLAVLTSEGGGGGCHPLECKGCATTVRPPHGETHVARARVIPRAPSRATLSEQTV